MLEPVSVVIPTHNSSLYIEETINSIIDQYSEQFLDIIIVDDLSADIVSLKLVISQFTCVRLIEKQKKSNAAESRNLGINASLYEKIFLLDSDDLFEDGYILKRIEFMNSNEGAIFFGPFIESNSISRREHDIPEYIDDDIRTYLFVKGGDFRTSTISINKKFYKKTMFDVNQYKHQDWGFGIRCYDNKEIIIQHYSYGVRICEGRHIQMSSKMNVEASKYFIERYLQSDYKYVAGFLKIHYIKAYLFRDKNAVLYFNELLKNVSFLNARVRKIKALSLLKYDLFSPLLSRILFLYLKGNNNH